MIPHEQIRTLVIRAILDNQESAARVMPDVGQITDDFCPIGDLEGFDSYSAMETVVELSELLGREIDEGIFISRLQDRRANIGEIVSKMCRIVNGKERTIDG